MEKEQNDRFYLQSKEYEGLLYDTITERDKLKSVLRDILFEIIDDAFDESGPAGKDGYALREKKKLLIKARKLLETGGH